jgi:diacylglycerol kinase family enzyme
MRPVVVINPAAGAGRAGAMETDIRAHLASRRIDATIVAPPSAEAMRHSLRHCAPGTRVALVGGDGTVHQALDALLEARLELGLVPFGSGNDFARALGVARWPWMQALDWALEGRASGIDLGEARFDGRIRRFASSLTCGFDSAVARRAAASPGWIPGRLRYLGATVAEVVRLRHWRLEVAADGRPAFAGPALFASVLNTSTYGSGLPVVPHARLDDHRLDLVIAGDFGRGGVLAMLPRLMAGRHLGDPRVRTQPCRQVTICAAPQAIPLAADGEALADAWQVEVAVLPAVLGAVRAPTGG